MFTKTVKEPGPPGGPQRQGGIEHPAPCIADPTKDNGAPHVMLTSKPFRVPPPETPLELTSITKFVFGSIPESITAFDFLCSLNRPTIAEAPPLLKARADGTIGREGISQRRIRESINPIIRLEPIGLELNRVTSVSDCEC